VAFAASIASAYSELIIAYLRDVAIINNATAEKRSSGEHQLLIALHLPRGVTAHAGVVCALLRHGAGTKLHCWGQLWGRAGLLPEDQPEIK
jgi:hypothetical protein